MLVFCTALEAVRVMGKLAENPMRNEDRLLASESAGSNLLSLAAQIALEVHFSYIVGVTLYGIIEV